LKPANFAGKWISRAIVHNQSRRDALSGKPVESTVIVGVPAPLSNFAFQD